MAATIQNPVWKDTYYTTSAATASFNIKLEGNTIFSGKAVKYPDADELSININRLCMNYLESDIVPLLDMMPSEDYQIENVNAVRTFNLYVNDINVVDYTFWMDYSYEE